MAFRNELRRAALNALATGTVLNLHRNFGIGEVTLYATLQQRVTGNWTSHDFMQVMWELVADGLVYIDFTQSSSSNWSWYVTERGAAAVASGTYDPADPDGYLKRLAAIQGLDQRIPVYAREALVAFEAKCFLASAVMIGVASEAAFDVLQDSFEEWKELSAGEARRFDEEIKGKQYAARFEQFRKRIDPKKSDLPPELAEGLDIILIGVLDLLRVNRNNSGHPTGRPIDEVTAYTSLRLFEGYLGRLYALKSYFDANPRPGSDVGADGC